jgi:UDP-N-acetylmuramoyl-L-alanyl-D-glutamate--2,6-diaminopimelate ligase
VLLSELIGRLALPPDAAGSGGPDALAGPRSRAAIELVPGGGGPPAASVNDPAASVTDPAGASGDPELLGVTEDSRETGPGWIFCAFRGASSDGRDFVPQAERNGCAATICAPPDPGGARPRILVPEARLREVASEAARLVCGEPDRRLYKIGVTGTNGKTTVCALAEAVLLAAGRRPGVLGTTGFRFPGGETREAPNTTPEGPLLWRTLRDMADAGADCVAMEVSSHALALGRLGSLGFDICVFTNLSRDHLDFHGDMESYFQAKRLLFTGAGTAVPVGGAGGKPGDVPARRAVINADDPYGRRLLSELGPDAVGFGFGDGRVRGTLRGSSREGLALGVVSPWGAMEIRSRLLGRFNAENLLAAAALGLVAGFPAELVGRALNGAGGAPGRLSRVGTDAGYLALVDYAHSPGAIEAAVAAVRELAPARLIVLFGCGGDRDRGKRPMMGRAAAGGDVAILTSDNPRTEDPDAIMDEAERGLAEAGLARVPGFGPDGMPAAEGGASGGSPANGGRAASGGGATGGTGVYLREPDRGKAIALGAGIMGRGDILLVCGKGHEDYQIVGREKRHFDDSEVTLAALKAAGKSS